MCPRFQQHDKICHLNEYSFCLAIYEDCWVPWFLACPCIPGNKTPLIICQRSCHSYSRSICLEAKGSERHTVGRENFRSILVPSQRIMKLCLLLKWWFLGHWNIFLKKKITKNWTYYSSHSNFTPCFGLITEFFLTVFNYYSSRFAVLPCLSMAVISVKSHSEVCSCFPWPPRPAFFGL